MKLNAPWFFNSTSDSMMPHSMRPHRRKVLAAASLLASTLVFFLAAPSSTSFKPHLTTIFPLTHTLTVATQPNLRILPLGDSITYGYRSTSGNGYRSHLYELLNETFPSVAFIGSQHTGNMTNNSNEGHPGYMIHDIAKEALQSLVLQPNVILIMAGTNDIARPYMPEDAPWRLAALIDFTILTCPFSVIIVAQLAPITEPPEALDMIRTYNQQIPGIVALRQQAGKKVMTVDMSQSLTTEYLYDGVHPNDQGYDIIAKTWFEGIQQAAQSGWIWEPTTLGRPFDLGGALGADGSQIPLRPIIKDGRTCQICV
ncbi:hypothetical protein K3495_g6126 [Podosphaera aphanis]|nr:hypothetical protein K3495_g6126 [Podosphaera aphanis]